MKSCWLYALILVVFILAMTAIFQFVWNWLAVDLFNAPAFTFWQSLGAIALLNFIGTFLGVGRK